MIILKKVLQNLKKKKKIFLEAKRLVWQQYCAQINPKTKIKKLWEIMRNTRTSTVNKCRSLDDNCQKEFFAKLISQNLHNTSLIPEKI